MGFISNLLDPIFWVEKLISLPAVLIALTFHEYAHGFVAWKLGDPTARTFGRLSLNPFKHLDPIGTACMILFGFGWAKPVPINARRFEKPRKGMALTAIAGPVMNLILGFIGMLIYAIVFRLWVGAPSPGLMYGFPFQMAFSAPTFTDALMIILLTFLQTFYILNISLAVFNLIPVPPLDGSRLLFVFLPPKYYFGLMKYERYIAIAMIALLWLGFLDTFLVTVVNWIVTAFGALIQLIPLL